jgi:hypothetical protein
MTTESTSSVDIQYFAESGTWRKLARAVRVDMLLQAAGSGGGIAVVGHLPATADGEDGHLIARSFWAHDLPDEVAVEVGKGGRGARMPVSANAAGILGRMLDGGGVGYMFSEDELAAVGGGAGANGYVLVLTHLAPSR